MNVLHMQGQAIEWPDSMSEADRHRQVASWLAALLAAEHVSLLVGSGLGQGLSAVAETDGLGMGEVDFRDLPHGKQVQARAHASAIKAGRGESNVEDQLRAALELHAGLQIMGVEAAALWGKWISETLTMFGKEVLSMERELRNAFDWMAPAVTIESGDQAEREPGDESGDDSDDATASAAESEPEADVPASDGEEDSDAEADDAVPPGVVARSLLSRFLLAFAGRPPARERLKIFTTNYDRLIEYGADQAGIRVLDRFVGSLEPVFRASRLDIDMHFNPPGIRGEPRYMEGVVHLAKLHGSVDWRFERDRVRRIPLRFGATDLDLGEVISDDQPGKEGPAADGVSAADGKQVAVEVSASSNVGAVDSRALQRLMIYPNAAKDVETLEYPYAELFRDFAAATCRPNSVLFTYGYGFGDDHINRVMKDMLTLSSTHLVVISFGDPGERIARFVAEVPPAQYTLMVGPAYGDLQSLVDNYLPYLGSDQFFGEQERRNRQTGRPPVPVEDGPDGDRNDAGA